MKNTRNVNIGGFAFVLDEDAHAVLDGYLLRSRKKLSSNPDGSEILEDLELAIAENLKTHNKEVIDIATAKAVVERLGEIDGESDDTREQDKTTSDSPLTGA